MKRCPSCRKVQLLTFVFERSRMCDRCFAVWLSFALRFTTPLLLSVIVIAQMKSVPSLLKVWFNQDANSPITSPSGLTYRWGLHGAISNQERRPRA
jgi:hypothetical protein